MKTIAVINAKGGCGKSTLAMNLASGLAVRGHGTLLIDMDPQSQVTQWLGAGDGLSAEGTLVAAMTGAQQLAEVIQPTPIANLSFVASSEALEEFGRQITDYEDYPTLLWRLLQQPGLPAFEFVVIDSPNQISPVMENAILPSDLFVVPFESTKAVRSYANLYKLLLKLKTEEAGRKEHHLLHVLNNLSRLPGLRKRVVAVMGAEGIAPARTEVRSDGWLAQVDEHGGPFSTTAPRPGGHRTWANSPRRCWRFFRRIRCFPPHRQQSRRTRHYSTNHHHHETTRRQKPSRPGSGGHREHDRQAGPLRRRHQQARRGPQQRA